MTEKAVVITKKGVSKYDTPYPDFLVYLSHLL